MHQTLIKKNADHKLLTSGEFNCCYGCPKVSDNVNLFGSTNEKMHRFAGIQHYCIRSLGFVQYPNRPDLGQVADILIAFKTEK